MNNSKKNENTNNSGNNYDNVSFLMTKAMVLVIMEELVTITKYHGVSWGNTQTEYHGVKKAKQKKSRLKLFKNWSDKRSNEYYLTLIHSCIEIMSRYHIR